LHGAGGKVGHEVVADPDFSQAGDLATAKCELDADVMAKSSSDSFSRPESGFNIFRNFCRGPSPKPHDIGAGLLHGSPDQRDRPTFDGCRECEIAQAGRAGVFQLRLFFQKFRKYDRYSTYNEADYNRSRDFSEWRKAPLFS
jgi:hypothetical protein